VLFLVATASLAQLIASCAPHVGRRTMSAVVAYESGGRPYAIDDDTARRAYFPRSRNGAARLVRSLLRAGHNLDVGFAQVNSGNFAALRIDSDSAFEPCTNLAAGARILREAYARAARTYGPGQRALFHALSAYNTGDLRAGSAYARAVFATARHRSDIANP